MNNLKIVSRIAGILSFISMALGIGVVTYYVEDIHIRGLSVFILTLTGIFVIRTVKLIHTKEIKSDKNEVYSPSK